MSRKYFGTDGVRGQANTKLTAEFALSLGQAAGRWLRQNGLNEPVVLGRDTRLSGPMLENALAAGFNSVGVSVVSLGVAPTPVVSYVARMGNFSLGGIISASHNPAPDNGIKFVGHDGRKLADEAELAIENLIEAPVEERPVGADLGRFSVDQSPVQAYLNYLETLLPERLNGMTVAVDCANGAASELGPQILERLGARVRTMACAPDGMYINAGVGATHPEVIEEFTVKCGADIGVAFDGDADRAVFSDEKGSLINGDRTIGIWSSHWQKAGKLDPAVVVGTVMSNTGFEHYLVQNGIRLERASVGDKYVADKIRETRARVGGEQSGHIIFPEFGPTGDGLITMLQLLRAIQSEGRPASAFVDDYASWPQLLVNVTVRERDGWDQGKAVSESLANAKEELGSRGRLVVRPSGTQPMIRVMVEADEYDLRDRVAASILAAMQEELAGSVYSRVDLTNGLGE